jgi:hypothetical protein
MQPTRSNPSRSPYSHSEKQNAKTVEEEEELYSAQRQNTTLAAGEMHGINVGEIRTLIENDDIKAYLAGEEQKWFRYDAQIQSTARDTASPKTLWDADIETRLRARRGYSD